MLALGTDNGVILYSIPKNSFQQIDIRTATQTSNDVESVYQDHLGDIWIFSKDPGIVHLNLVTNEKSICSPQKMRLSSMGVKVANLFLKIMRKTYGYSPRKETFATMTGKKELSNRFLRISIILSLFSVR